MCSLLFKELIFVFLFERLAQYRPRYSVQKLRKLRRVNIKAKAVPSKSASKTSGMNAGFKRLGQYKPKLQKLVPETNFALRDFPWSPWNILMSSEPRKGPYPVIQPVGSEDKVIEYTHDYVLYKRRSNQSALHELAVKPLGCRQKRVVYAKICPKFPSYTAQWPENFNHSRSLQKQINNIIQKQDGDILLRRLVPKKYKRYEDILSIVRNCDYVWSPDDGAKKYRELKKDSYVISEDMDV